MYQVIKYTPLLASLAFKDTYNDNIIDFTMESDKEVISRLKFIGRIQKGEKINVKYLYVQPEGILTSISRSIISKDNRRNTLSFVRNVISKTFDIISSYQTSSKESRKQMCSHIVDDLKNAKSGIQNLKDTYIDDIKFCCDLDTLLQDIETKLIDLDPIEIKYNTNPISIPVSPKVSSNSPATTFLTPIDNINEQKDELP